MDGRTPKTVPTARASNLPLSVGLCVVEQGQMVKWGAPEGHTISVWFPHEGIFATTTPDPAGATVLPDAAPLDTPIAYCIYDHTDGVFIEGNSHPLLIIKKP